MAGNKHYLELDGLRGVAAVCVALHHQQAYFGGAGFFGHGYLAVDFFYMLSGFVLTHAYAGRLQHRSAIVPYLRDRAIRLYPMLIAGALLGLLAVACGLRSHYHAIGPAAVAAVVDAAGLPAVWYADPFWINSPTWSLFFELVANLVFAFVAARLTARREWIAAAVFCAAMLALDYRLVGFDFGFTRNTLIGGFARVGAGFTIGVILYRLHNAGVLAGGGRRWWVAPVLVVSLMLLPSGSKLSAFYDPVVVLGLYPLLILAAAGSRDLIPRVAILSGALSYPFYATHIPVLTLLQALMVKAGYRLEAPTVIVSLLGAIGVAWLLFEFYDQPLRKGLRARFGSKAHRDTTVV
jgi:peptidoglycan/LPS O-acetylase OafA/YrhL